MSLPLIQISTPRSAVRHAKTFWNDSLEGSVVITCGSTLIWLPAQIFNHWATSTYKQIISAICGSFTLIIDVNFASPVARLAPRSPWSTAPHTRQEVMATSWFEELTDGCSLVLRSYQIHLSFTQRLTFDIYEPFFILILDLHKYNLNIKQMKARVQWSRKIQGHQLHIVFTCYIYNVL